MDFGAMIQWAFYAIVAGVVLIALVAFGLGGAVFSLLF